ncbi:MAG: hypothetical protein WD052_06885 [Bacteroidales bacterium]
MEIKMEQYNKDHNKQLGETEKKQISILRSGNSKAIIDTIDEIKGRGRASILPEIFDLLLITMDQDVIAACTTLLNDLKIDEASEYIIPALKDQKYIPVRQILVSSCWQSGIDFHTDYLLFAEIFLSDDYATAIEAFTVLENCIGELTDRDIVQLTGLLESGLKTVPAEKKALVSELLLVIRSY